MTDEKIIFEINDLINKSINTSIPVRILFNDYIRKNKFNSKKRKEISDFFYNAVRYHGLFKRDILNFKSNIKNISFNRLEEKKVLKEICGFDTYVADLIIKSLKNKRFQDFFLKRAPLTVRVNNLLISREKLFNRLSIDYNVEKTSISPYGVIFNDNINVRSLFEFKKGLFEIQDEASQLISLISPVNPSNRILDYCAGTGGKSLSYYSHFYGSVSIDVHDVSQKRLKKLFERAKKLKYNLGRKISGSYDFVLIDAPCSGLGSIRRDADLNLRLNKRIIDDKINLQRQIFNEAKKFVKLGGYVLYVTCSFLEEENEEQISYFTNRYSDLELVPLTEKVDKFYFDAINQEGFYKTGPWLNGMDSFFAALFKLN